MTLYNFLFDLIIEKTWLNDPIDRIILNWISWKELLNANNIADSESGYISENKFFRQIKFLMKVKCRSNHVLSKLFEIEMKDYM